MSIEEKYLQLSEDQIDNLLLGVDLNDILKSNKILNKENEEKEENKICISCKSDKLIIDNAKGYLVCQDCAVINKEFLDKNIEYSNDPNKNSRYGCPSNFFFPKSALGTKISSKGYNRVAILQRQGQMPYREKSLLDVLERIQLKCKKYNITQSIIDCAKILYKKVSDCKHTKGKRKGKNMIMRCINRRSMIAACVFYACKMQKEPRSPKEISDIYDLDIKHVNRGCRKFLDIMDISTIFFELRSSQSSDFIERFAKQLNIDKKYITIIKDISSNIHKLGFISTHEPPSVAAGCILLVANMYNGINITKKQISDIFSISDVTISKTYRKISQYSKIIMDNDVTNLILETKNKSVNKPLNLSEDNLICSETSNNIFNSNKLLKKNIKIFDSPEEEDEEDEEEDEDEEDEEDKEDKEEDEDEEDEYNYLLDNDNDIII
jgi:transcription initiation factor TFIIIB Brf1 subunit/transcription initiation factor TFIIB